MLVGARVCAMVTCVCFRRGRFGQVHKCAELSSGLTLAAKIIKVKGMKERVSKCGQNQQQRREQQQPLCRLTHFTHVIFIRSVYFLSLTSGPVCAPSLALILLFMSLCPSALLCVSLCSCKHLLLIIPTLTHTNTCPVLKEHTNTNTHPCHA